MQLSVEKKDVETRIDFLRLKALVINKLGDSQGAIGHLNRALQISRKIGDKGRESQVLNYLTRIHWYLSQYYQVVNYSNRALKAARELNDTNNLTSILNYLGIYYSELGNHSKALECFESAYDYCMDLGDKGTSAILVGNMAGAYARLGNEPKSLTLYKHSIEIMESLGVGWDKARANYLDEMGTVYLRTGDYEKALDLYEQALHILRQFKTEGHQISEILSKIGKIYQVRGDYTKALEYYERALNTKKQIFKQSTRAANLIHVAGLYVARGEYSTARSYYEKALTIGKKIRKTELIWPAQAGLAHTLSKQGQYRTALELYSSAVRTIEDIRSQLWLEEERIGFVQDKMAIYADMIGLLAELHQQNPETGYDDEAFHYAERAKARALLDLIYQCRTFHYLNEIPTNFRQKFLMNEKKLKQKYIDLANELAKEELQRSQNLIFSLNNEIETLQRKKAQLPEEVKQKFPRYYQLTPPQILTAEEVQGDILNDSQILVEYLVGQKHLFVWALTKSNLRFQTLDLTREELENKLARISPLFQKEKAAQDVQIDHRWANIQADRLHDLYQILIQTPVGDLIKPGMELVIVPDDVLHYFPFEILVTQLQGDSIRYLVETHPISYAASASLLNPQLRREQQATQDLLAYGNPDFGREQSNGIAAWVNSLVPFKSIFPGGGGSNRCLMRNVRWRPLRRISPAGPFLPVPRPRKRDLKK